MACERAASQGSAPCTTAPPSGGPIDTREGDELICSQYKQIFALRNSKPEHEAVSNLIALFDSTASVLLRHEVAYCLGQMRSEVHGPL